MIQIGGRLWIVPKTVCNSFLWSLCVVTQAIHSEIRIFLDSLLYLYIRVLQELKFAHRSFKSIRLNQCVLQKVINVASTQKVNNWFFALVNKTLKFPTRCTLWGYPVRKRSAILSLILVFPHCANRHFCVIHKYNLCTNFAALGTNNRTAQFYALPLKPAFNCHKSLR